MSPSIERRGWRASHYVLAHELGHMWDAEHMTDDRRADFSAMVHLPFSSQTWLNANIESRGRVPVAGELFADAYALCALGPNYRAWNRRTFGFGMHYGGGYGPLSRSAVAATCWLLDHPPR